MLMRDEVLYQRGNTLVRRLRLEPGEAMPCMSIPTGDSGWSWKAGHLRSSTATAMIPSSFRWNRARAVGTSRQTVPIGV